MLRFLLGVAVGATLAMLAGHAYREREKQHLVNEIAKLHADNVRMQDGLR
jgi:hypothetical protein